MVSKILVVEAEVSDADTMADLHGRAFSRGWSGDECAALLSDRRVIGLLAVRRNLFRTSPVGFLLAREAAGEAEILSVGVVPRARRSGAGRALLSTIIGRLRQRGASDLFLEVEEGNEPALALYRSFGFRKRGRRESYYRPETTAPAAALILHLDL